MSSFTFPPPPPPPPKQTNQQHSHNGYQMENSYGSSRGGRGMNGSRYGHRGRGGFDGNRGDYGMHRGRGGSSGYSARGGQHGLSTGDKRKWSDRGGREGSHQKLQGPQPAYSRNPNMNVAPAVPSFGFSLPTAPPQYASTSQPASPVQAKQKTQRKHNILGLTPKGADREDSDQEVDEEAAFAAQLMVQSGSLPNPKNRVEMAAWLAERKKRYPTKARLEEKQKSEREAELQRLKHKVKASRESNQAKAAQASTAVSSGKSKEDRQREKLEKHLRKADKLRLRLAQDHPASKLPSQDMTHTLPKPSLLGSNYESEDESKCGSEARPNASMIEDASSESDSDTSTSQSSDDEVPEEASSKHPLPTPKPRFERKPAEREPIPEYLIPWVKRGFCKDFMQQKPCRYGNRCRSRHKIPQEVRDIKLPRKRLFDRLVEQEVHAENMAAVNAIKALGASGFFHSLP